MARASTDALDRASGRSTGGSLPPVATPGGIGRELGPLNRLSPLHRCLLCERMRLFVGNLPWEFSSEDLRNLFSEFGEVAEALVVKDRVSGRSRGFGFVDMAKNRHGTTAAQSLNGSVVGGRALTVNPARQRIAKA